MIKKTMRSVTALLLAALMAFSTCSTAIAASIGDGERATSVINYVSICNGTSADNVDGSSCGDGSYADLFAAWLAGYFGESASGVIEGYNGKVNHTPLSARGLLAVELKELLKSDAESIKAVTDAHVISLDVGSEDFGEVMLSDIKNIADGGSLTEFSSAHSVDLVYTESGLPQSVKDMISVLVSGYGDVIADLADDFAGGDKDKAIAIDYVITYRVVSFLVNYVEALDLIVKLNGDVTVLQLALIEECADSETAVNGTTLRNFADTLVPSFNGVIASMPSILITSDSETYKNASLLYADSENHKSVFDAMRRAYTETYLKDSDSFYVALGDDSVKNRTTYVSLLASGLGFTSATYKNLGQKGHKVNDTISVVENNADVIAGADFITVGYSSNIFLKAAGDELNNIMTNRPATEFDWTKLLGDDSHLSFTDFIDDLEERLIAEGLDVDFNGRNLKDMLLSAIEAYAYTCVEHEMNLPLLIDAIREVSPDALIVCVGFYNGVENVKISVDGAEFDISEYVQLVVEFANAQNRYHTSHRDNVILIDIPDVETVRESTGNTKPFSFMDFIREITSSSGASFLPSANGCAQIRDLIISAISKHTHDYSAEMNAPTCTDSGYAKYTCACGVVHETNLSATGHSYKESSRTEPTCTEKGTITFTCTGCGISYTDTGDSATGHTYKESSRTEPSCTENGTITFTCTGCGISYTDTGDSATGHTYKESSRTEPTCTEKGTITFTCSSCGSSYTDTGDSATGHTYKESSRTEPTCTEKGTITFTCTGCGSSYTDTGDSATGHTYKESSRTEPTCTEKGTITYTCSGCGSSYTETVKALGHTTGTFCGLCGLHLCDGKTNCPANNFTDLDSAKWYHKSVDFVISTGLMNGQSADRFGPDGETTRAMFVTTLYRLEGSPKVTGSASFSDVESGMWYSDAILWAEQNSIVNGVGAGRFAPNDNVTREQIALMFYRYFNLKGVELDEKSDFAGFTDKGDISSWAKDAMSWAVGAGFITGRSPTTLVPLANSNRSELATLLYRAKNNFLK